MARASAFRSEYAAIHFAFLVSLWKPQKFGAENPIQAYRRLYYIYILIAMLQVDAFDLPLSQGIETSHASLGYSLESSCPCEIHSLMKGLSLSTITLEITLIIYEIQSKENYLWRQLETLSLSALVFIKKTTKGLVYMTKMLQYQLSLCLYCLDWLLKPLLKVSSACNFLSNWFLATWVFFFFLNVHKGYPGQ